MGGTILLDSTPGVGTTAQIYLPAQGGAAAKMTTPTPLRPAAGGVAEPLPQPEQKRRVLLMDDEQMILDIVSRMLTHLGYEVSTSTNGAQAIAAFAKAKSNGQPFDVVVMDLVIPNGVGGQDAVHTIRKIDEHARVIASSGHLEHPAMVDYKKFGFVAVLEKPYKLERLQQVIDAVIDSPA
jgi:DNA-binding NtrC family response regulator